MHYALKRLKVGPNVWRNPGDAVPETATWPQHIVRAHVDGGFIEVRPDKVKPETVASTTSGGMEKTHAFTCAMCKKDYKSERFYYNHLKRVHGVE